MENIILVLILMLNTISLIIYWYCSIVSSEIYTIRNMFRDIALSLFIWFFGFILIWFHLYEYLDGKIFWWNFKDRVNRFLDKTIIHNDPQKYKIYNPEYFCEHYLEDKPIKCSCHKNCYCRKEQCSQEV